MIIPPSVSMYVIDTHALHTIFKTSKRRHTFLRNYVVFLHIPFNILPLSFSYWLTHNPYANNEGHAFRKRYG